MEGGVKAKTTTFPRAFVLHLAFRPEPEPEPEQSPEAPAPEEVPQEQKPKKKKKAAHVKYCEEGFAKLQDSDECSSLLKKFLTKEVLDQLKSKKTPTFKSTLKDVIQSGNPADSLA